MRQIEMKPYIAHYHYNFTKLTRIGKILVGLSSHTTKLLQALQDNLTHTKICAFYNKIYKYNIETEKNSPRL